MRLYICLLTNLLFAATIYGQCDRSIISDLSYKISGSRVAFPCDSTKNIYVSTGRYSPKSILITRIQFYKDTVFGVVPRLKSGVPSTLVSFSLKNKDTKITLLPYPCWSLQEEGNSAALQSAVDLCLDQAEILWVLDTGIVNTLEQPVRRCAPKIVGISVKTGQVVKIIDLSLFVTSESRLQYIAVEYNNEGQAFAYIADGGVGAIIVYDIFGSKGYRVVLPSAASQGTLYKDVLYIALIRKSSENYLYFTYLSSPRMFYIKTTFLQQGQASSAIIDIGQKPRPIVILGTDNGEIIFFRFKGFSDIYIWNTNTCFKSDNFLLVQKGDDCRLATQVVPGYKRLMWVLESNFYDYVANKVGCLGASVVIHPLIKICE